MSTKDETTFISELRFLVRRSETATDVEELDILAALFARLGSIAARAQTRATNRLVEQSARGADRELRELFERIDPREVN